MDSGSQRLHLPLSRPLLLAQKHRFAGQWLKTTISALVSSAPPGRIAETELAIDFG
jgi:hypothetical protein